MRGVAGSDKSKHLEYTAYFWKGNINNIADFSWVITLSPPDLCFYPTGGLFKPCFCSNPCIGGSKGGARDACPPWGSKFFHFHAVFGKKLKNNSIFGSWRPPGENPESATAMVYSGLSSCQTSRPASREYSPKSILVYFNHFKYCFLNITFKALYSLVISQWMSLLQVL